MTQTEIFLIGFIVGLIVGIPIGMIYEDAKDVLKIVDKRRDKDETENI